MPTLFRFLLVLLLLGGFVLGGMFALATFVDPRPRDMSYNVPSDRLPRGDAAR